MQEISSYTFIGDFLKDMRASKKKTQKEVASEVGMSPAAVGFAEVEQKPINPVNLKKLADYYDVPLEELEKLEQNKGRSFGKKSPKIKHAETVNSSNIAAESKDNQELQVKPTANSTIDEKCDLNFLPSFVKEFLSDKKNANTVIDWVHNYTIKNK